MSKESFQFPVWKTKVRGDFTGRGEMETETKIPDVGRRTLNRTDNWDVMEEENGSNT